MHGCTARQALPSAWPSGKKTATSLIAAGPCDSLPDLYKAKCEAFLKDKADKAAAKAKAAKTAEGAACTSASGCDAGLCCSSYGGVCLQKPDEFADSLCMATH